MRQAICRVLLLLMTLLTGTVQAQHDPDSINPQLETFVAGVNALDAEALADETVLVPVTWASRNRPQSANLFFEQMLPDGQIINVELPRPVAFIPDSGSGTIKPVLPGPDATQVDLRLRMMDTISGQVYDTRYLTLPIITLPASTGDYITEFRTARAFISQRELLDIPRVMVSWDIVDRPPQTNLIFEQVFPEGTTRNAELPRDFDLIPSAGAGNLTLISPAGNPDQIVLRLRLVRLTDNQTLDSRTLTLPVESDLSLTPSADPGQVPRIESFEVTPLSATRDESVTVRWSTDGADRVILDTPGRFYTGLSPSGEMTVPVRRIARATSPVELRLSACRGQDCPESERVFLTLDDGAGIQSFTIAPQSAGAGEPVTLTWQLYGDIGSGSQLEWFRDGAWQLLSAINSSSDSLTLTLPETLPERLSFRLTAMGDDGIPHRAFVHITTPD